MKQRGGDQRKNTGSGARQSNLLSALYPGCLPKTPGRHGVQEQHSGFRSPSSLGHKGEEMTERHCSAVQSASPVPDSPWMSYHPVLHSL